MDIERKDIERQSAEEKMVNDAFQHLLNTYLESPHRKKTDIITKAFNFAKQAHKGVRRLSGEPYIMHPLSVAQIASEEMGLGSTSICSALLHDVVEDTDYTVEDIANIFGEKIAQIVDGLTKISGGIFGEKASAQAENFKKLLLTMNDDIRVILIKICDRLHNMRTLESQPANKQYKIAGETLYIYAPLAHRLGLYKIKTELENLSFRFEHPEEYDAITEKLKFTQEERDKLFEDFTTPIKKVLDENGTDYQIKARVKSPYSIWNKMQTKHVTFDEIYDILAVRIIFKPKDIKQEKNECFNIYLAISQIYDTHPGRLRDWLSTKKNNGYQALHATLMSKQGKWIEVQIRSERMDEVAEQGLAAHWKYKNGAESENEERQLDSWLRTIKEILDDPQPDAMDFLDSIKMNLFSSEITVFTPKGEIKTMPQGSTALDFAFQIHTFLGSHCIGAKVNHKLVPLSHKLKSGDQVEILSSPAQRVKPEWLNFVSTAKAKGKVQATLRRYNRETQKQGEEKFKQWLSDNQLDPTSQLLNRLCQRNGMTRLNDFFVAVGNGSIKLDDHQLELLRNNDETGKRKRWITKYIPFVGNDKKKAEEHANKPQPMIVGEDFNKKKPIIISEQNIEQFHFPTCCHAIPGDDILGFITNKKHIDIHKRQCHVADRLKTSYGNRILDARWNMHRQLFFDATIVVEGIDRKALLLDVSKVLSDELDINIHQITIRSNEGLFHGTIELSVHERADMKIIIDNLKKIKGLQDVQQYQ